MPDTPEAAPITKADLRAVLDAVERLGKRIEVRIDHLEARMERSETNLLTELHKLEARQDHLEARIERTETSLLTEFHKWASPTEMRLRSHSAALRALDMQQESADDALRSMSERLAALERKAEGRQPPSQNQ